MVFGTEAVDPMTYVVVLGAVLIVTLAAAAVPAWRASGIRSAVSSPRNSPLSAISSRGVTTRQTTKAAIIWLLASSISVDYIDRTNLAIAGPLVSSELHLTGSQFGLLLRRSSSPTRCSSWCQVRWPIGWTSSGSWPAASRCGRSPLGWPVCARLRRALRGPTHPRRGRVGGIRRYSPILSYHFTEEQRGWPNAVILAGFSFGLASGLFFGGMLVGRIGWRPFFIGLCAISLLWLIPWLLVMPPTPAHSAAESHKCPTALEILARREFLGTALGLFCGNYSVTRCSRGCRGIWWRRATSRWTRWPSPAA